MFYAQMKLSLQIFTSCKWIWGGYNAATSVPAYPYTKAVAFFLISKLISVFNWEQREKVG
jgi:hypothetical protein